MNRLQIRYCSAFVAAALHVGIWSGVHAQEDTAIVAAVAPASPTSKPARPAPVSSDVTRTAPRAGSGQPAERIPAVELPPLKTGSVKIALPGDRPIATGRFDKPIVIEPAAPQPPVEIEIPMDPKVAVAQPKPDQPRSAATSTQPKTPAHTVARRPLQMPATKELPRHKTRVPGEPTVEKPVEPTPAATTAAHTEPGVETPPKETTISIPQTTSAPEGQPNHTREVRESPEVPRFRAEEMAELPGTYKDPTHLFSGAASMQLREAEETRRDYLIGEVGALLANRAARLAAPCLPINVNMPEQAEEKVLVRHVYSECQADGFWHVVEDTWYDAGGGQVYKRRTYDKKTEQRCKDASGAQLPEPAEVRQLTSQVMQPQEYGIAVEDGLTVELRCENGLWYRYVYRRFRLQDGSHRRHHSPERIEHTNVPCDQPRPPAVGGPVRIIDAPPLKASRPVF